MPDRAKVTSLEAIEDSRDQRGVEEAVAALDLDDEPEVLIAACRVLGPFPDTPGIAEKVTPLLLDSPYLEVKRLAALVLSRNPESDLAAMASQWSGNHEGLSSEDPYDELPGIPSHYAAMGFPDYPGAEWFTPADSDRSVGWWSADPPSVVAARLGEMLGVEAMDYQQWIERSQQQMMNAYQSIDQAKVDEVQKLTPEFIKTQDDKLLERIESLQSLAGALLVAVRWLPVGDYIAQAQRQIWQRRAHVGALAVVNANGSAIDPETALPWAPDRFGLRSPNERERRRLRRQLTGQAASLNTTIGIVATSAALSKTEASKMSDVAHDGLARAIRPAHSMFDGDTIFGLATGEHDIGDLPAAMRSTPSRQSALDLILAAAADTFAAACAHAVLTATTLGDTPAYFDLCTSARPRPRGRTGSAQ